MSSTCRTQQFVRSVSLDEDDLACDRDNELLVHKAWSQLSMVPTACAQEYKHFCAERDAKLAGEAH